MNSKLIRSSAEFERDLKQNFILHTPYYYANHEVTATCRKCGFKDTKNASTFMYLGCAKCKEVDMKIDLYLSSLAWRRVVNRRNSNEDMTLLVCERCDLKRIVSYKEDLLTRGIGKCRCFELGTQPLQVNSKSEASLEEQMKRGYYVV